MKLGRHKSSDGQHILLIEKVKRGRVHFRWPRLFGKNIKSPAKAWIKEDAAAHFFKDFGIEV